MTILSVFALKADPYDVLSLHSTYESLDHSCVVGFSCPVLALIVTCVTELTEQSILF